MDENKILIPQDGGQLIDKAIHFATDAFHSQKRKLRGESAVFHALEAGAIAATVTADAEIVSACILHDMLEDTDTTLEQIRENFGERVAMLVGLESEDKQPERSPEDSWQDRKEKSLELLKNSSEFGLKVMYLADKLSNIRSIRSVHYTMGDELWNMFHQNDPRKHCWYYESVLELTSELQNTAAWLEYQELVGRVFEKWK